MWREQSRNLEAELDSFVYQVHTDRVEEAGCGQNLASMDAVVFNKPNMYKQTVRTAVRR